jgi:hypothetical protein
VTWNCFTSAAVIVVIVAIALLRALLRAVRIHVLAVELDHPALTFKVPLYNVGGLSVNCVNPNFLLTSVATVVLLMIGARYM